MIVIGALALITKWLPTMIEDRLLPWHPQTTVSDNCHVAS
jgi:ABC-type nitrate/sulfonate/bicarbonate transport system permease component